MRILLGIVLLLGSAAHGVLAWEEAAALPVALHEPFTGVVEETLVVAGGYGAAAGQPPDRAVYALDRPGGTWALVAQLPEGLAGGASVPVDDALWLIGGEGAAGFSDRVYRIRRAEQAWLVEEVEAAWLPAPRSGAGAVVLGDHLYLAGGAVGSGEAVPAPGLRLPLPLPETAGAVSLWEEAPFMPGPLRHRASVGGRDGTLYVFGGEDPTTGTVLQDAYAYTPAGGWRRLADLPEPLAGAGVLPLGAAHMLLLGGTGVGRRPGRPHHEGVGAAVWGYHTVTNTFARIAMLPEAVTGQGASVWQGRLALAGGLTATGDAAASVLLSRDAPRASVLGRFDYACIVLYLGLLVGIGFYFSREKNTERFFLGGRKVPWWAVGISIFGTSISAITYLSIPARAYATDWGFFFANLGVLFIAPFVVGWYVPRFREAPIATAYEFLERRFNLAVRIYGSLCFLLFQMGRIGIVMLLPALALSAATGLDKYWAIAIMGVLATIYTVAGGIEAVIWTDVLQSFVLVLGALLALVLIVGNIEGGLPAMVAEAQAAGKLHAINWTWDPTVPALWLVILGNAFSNLYPATADQTVVQRYLSTTDARAAGRAVWTNALLTLPITVLFFAMGTGLWVYFRHHPEQLDPLLQNDAILPLFVVHQFPAGLRGILIAGIFAAAMSSLDSSINSIASVLINDYYRRFRKIVSEREAMWAARGITLAFGLAGTGAAMYAAGIDATSLWEPFLKLLNYAGGGLAGIMALGVFTRRANGPGALLGAAASAVAIYCAGQTSLHFFSHGLIGFWTAFGVGYLASRKLGGSSGRLAQAD